MKRILIIIFLLIAFNLSAQIKIDKGGDFWDREVSKALTKIEQTDQGTYDFVLTNVDQISYWNEGYNSIDYKNGKKVILLSSKQFGKSINNLASTIVHESYHLSKVNLGNKVCSEEIEAYQFELQFLFKLKDAENWLIEFVYSKIQEYKTDCK
jgi:hypothetical protein